MFLKLETLNVTKLQYWLWLDLKIRLVVLFSLLLGTAGYFVSVFILLKGLWRVHLYFFLLLLFWLFEDLFKDFLCLEDFFPIF